MSKCKMSKCKKEAEPGEEYCCACRDKKARRTRNIFKTVVVSIATVAVGAWIWITKGDSSNA